MKLLQIVSSSFSRAAANFVKFLSVSVVSVMLSLTAGTSVYAVESDVAVEQHVQTININQASAEELADVLDGVGEAKAAAIVAYRDANGAFKSADQLMEVKGIGEATFEKNKARISL
jgi:competence protein ComEA